MAKPTSSSVGVRLDQWADGPVSEGDLDGTGKNNEVFVNGNLNAQKAHFNEGDAIPYRAIMDDLTTNVVYSITIQWDTVDSGSYALDYLTGYNYSFDGSRHPGEPDVIPTAGVGDVSHLNGNPVLQTQVAIPSDSRLLTGFGTGTQFGITDGLASGQPSGQQYVTIFGSVTDAHAGPITYNADGTKASMQVFFTYTGGTADNNDSVVLAWGGHIASSLDWRDDAGETVQTASDINGSPYHMRVLEISEDGVPKSIGNQDRSLSADAVLPPPVPTATDVVLLLDEDDIAGVGNNDTATGDDTQSASLTGTLTVTDATSVDFSALDGTTVKDTSGNDVTSGGATHPLTYVWDSSTSTLYARTDPTDAATTIFSIDINGTGPFTYSVAMLGKIDHPDTGDVNTEDPNVVVNVPYVVTGLSGTDTADFQLTFDDDIPVRAASPTAVTATVQEDGLSTADTPESGTAALDGDDLSDGNAESGEANTSDQASGATGSLASLVSVGADSPGMFDLNLDTKSLATLWSQGTALTYTVSDTDANGFNDKLVATAGSRTVFTLTVATDGAWKFDMDDQLDHVDDGKNDENTALRAGATGTDTASGIDFSSVLRVTDSDNDTVSPLLAGDFAITVKDDVPVGYTPDGVKLTNTGTDVQTAALNSGGKVGADEAATILFVDDDTTDSLLRDTNGTVLTSNALDISLSGFGTDTLTASTTEGTVFTATLDATKNQYTIDFDKVIDDGGGINFLGAAPVKSGNPTYNVINNVDGTTLDLLFSGGDTEGGAPTSHSVNVSTQGAGTDNQSMNATGTGTSAIGDLLRIDFMVGAALSGSPNGSSFTPGTYQNVNGYSFLVSQNNPGGTTATAFVQCVDANADSQLISNLDQVDPITKVTVNGQILLDAGTFHNLTINGKSVTGSMLNGGVVIQGLNEGSTGDGAGGDDPVIKVWTGTGFNRVEVSNYAGQPISGSQNYGGHDFDIAPAGVDQAVQGSQFNFNLYSQMTDYDGDNGPVETMGVTVNPVPV